MFGVFCQPIMQQAVSNPALNMMETGKFQPWDPIHSLMHTPASWGRNLFHLHHSRRVTYPVHIESLADSFAPDNYNHLSRDCSRSPDSSSFRTERSIHDHVFHRRTGLLSQPLS